MTTERISTVEASQPVAGAASQRSVPHVSVIAAPQAGPDSGCLHRRLGGRFCGWLTGPVSLGAGRAVSCPNKASVGHVRVFYTLPLSQAPALLFRVEALPLGAPRIRSEEWSTGRSCDGVVPGCSHPHVSPAAVDLVRVLLLVPMKNLATTVTLILFAVLVIGSIWYVWKHESDGDDGPTHV